MKKWKLQIAIFPGQAVCRGALTPEFARSRNPVAQVLYFFCTLFYTASSASDSFRAGMTTLCHSQIYLPSQELKIGPQDCCDLGIGGQTL